MNKDNIILIIKEILNNEIELSVKDTKPDKTLIELGIDSISLMTLIVYIEDRLSIEIDLTDGLSEEYSKITLDTFIKAIQGKLEQQNDIS